ncbi:MAG: flagellar M-ring protein FliF [Clostridiaceae bacterium]|jgi:flagellar M-ring protein FliF|nr:flagellar M-ring protein FliF [Clostridiaceae bacterium]
MPEGLVKLWDKIKDYWRDLEKGQKTSILVTAGVILAAIVFTLFISLKTDYVPLLESGNEYDVKAIVDYLDTNRIKYKKASDQILVDSSRKADIEFDLASEAGLISPDVIFDQSWSKLSLTVTEEDKAKLWRQFEQTNLVYKLKKFENVLDASVQYTKPEKTYWASKKDTEDQGSAFVSLKTKGRLTPEQVDACARVVAASIGIPKENITLVDEFLNPLNASQSDYSIGVAGTQEEMRRDRELELEQKVYKHFRIGMIQNANFDTMSVTVSAKLDFDVLNSRELQYSAPDSDGEGFVKILETLEEKLENAQPGQAPGLDTNPGTTTYQVGSDGNSRYEKEQNLEERLFNEKEIESSKALGKLIPSESRATITLWYGHAVETADSLTTEYIDQIKADASNAMGIPVNNISVSIQKLLPEVVAEVQFSDTLGMFIERYGLYILMLILLAVMVILMIPRKKEEIEEELAAEPEAAFAGPQFIVPEKRMPGLPNIELGENDELKEQIEKFAAAKPDAVAQLLRNWLTEDWD